MDIREISVKLDGGGNGAKVALSGAHAESAALSLPNKPTSGGADMRDSVLVYVTCDCFVRNAPAPIAIVDIDIPLAGGNIYRLSGLKDQDKLSFITDGRTGTAWVYPGA